MVKRSKSLAIDLLIVPPEKFNDEGYTGQMKRRISLKNVVLNVINDIRKELNKPKLKQLIEYFFGEQFTMDKMQREKRNKFERIVKNLYARSSTEVYTGQKHRFKKINILLSKLETQLNHENIKMAHLIRHFKTFDNAINKAINKKRWREVKDLICLSFNRRDFDSSSSQSLDTLSSRSMSFGTLRDTSPLVAQKKSQVKASLKLVVNSCEEDLMRQSSLSARMDPYTSNLYQQFQPEMESDRSHKETVRNVADKAIGTGDLNVSEMEVAVNDILDEFQRQQSQEEETKSNEGPTNQFFDKLRHIAPNV